MKDKYTQPTNKENFKKWKEYILKNKQDLPLQLKDGVVIGARKRRKNLMERKMEDLCSPTAGDYLPGHPACAKCPMMVLCATNAIEMGRMARTKIDLDEVKQKAEELFYSKISDDMPDDSDMVQDDTTETKSKKKKLSLAKGKKKRKIKKKAATIKTEESVDDEWEIL